MAKNLDAMFSSSLLISMPPYADELAAIPGFIDDASSLQGTIQCFDTLNRPCVALDREARLCLVMVAVLLLSADRNTASKVVMETIVSNVGASNVVNPSVCSACHFGVSDADIRMIFELSSSLKTIQDSTRHW